MQLVSNFLEPSHALLPQPRREIIKKFKCSYKRWTCCSSFSSFFVSVFISLGLLPFSLPFSTLAFPSVLSSGFPNPISTFPTLLHCLQHCQDQLCYFPCCCPACCLESYFLAFREHQRSQISYFHHTHCPFLSNELMNPPEGLGACRAAWLPLQSISHLKMSPLYLWKWMVALAVFTHWELFWKQQLADSLSLEVHSYLGLGSRLSNAMHGVCSGSLSSLITLSIKDVSRLLWCHLRMWSSGHWVCQEDLGGGAVQLLLSYPAISASTSPGLLWSRGPVVPLYCVSGFLGTCVVLPWLFQS